TNGKFDRKIQGPTEKRSSTIGDSTMNRRLLRTVLAGGTAVTILTGGAWATDVLAQAPVVVQPAPPAVVQPAPPPVVVQPSAPTVVVPSTPGAAVVVPSNPAVPQIVLADTIKAHEVHAQAIYPKTVNAR